MNRKGKILKNTLIVNVSIMLVAGVYAICGALYNMPFFYEGSKVVLAPAMQIKMIIIIVLCLATIIYPLLLMIKLVGNIGENKIFYKDNIKIMERVAKSLGLYGLFSLIGGTINISVFLGITNTTIEEAVLGELSISKFGINLSIEGLAIISVVSIIIAMIEVIKEGMKIQEENELIV